MVNVKQPFNIDIGAKVPALAAVSKDIRTKLGGAFNKVKNTVDTLGKNASGLGSKFQQLKQTASKAVAGVLKVFKKSDKQINKTTKQTDEQRKGFPAWALSLMFAGQMVNRMFMGILRSGTQAFHGIMRSQDYTRSSYEEFSNTMTKLWFQVGQALEPLWEWLTKIVDKIAEFVSNNPKFAKWATIIGVVVGLFFIILGSVALFIKAIATVGALLLLKVLIIMAVVAAILWVIFNWDKVWEFLKKLWGWIKQAFNWFIDLIIHVANVIWDAIGWALGKVWEGILWVWGKIKQAFNWVIDGIVWVAEKIWSALKWAFNKVWDGVKWLWDKFLDFRVWLINLFISIGESIANGLISGIEWAINGAIKLINNLIRQINKIPGINIGTIGNVDFGRADFGRIERADAGELGGDGGRLGGSADTYNDNRTIEVNVEVDDSEGIDELLSEYTALR